MHRARVATGGPMAIEKAFAINASQREIYDAIERDIADAEEHAGQTHEVLRRDPPRSIDLRVTMSGMPCYLSYAIKPRPGGDCEVAATLQPYGRKYAIFRFLTLGMHDGGFAVALVHSLANLKDAVENRSELQAADDLEGEDFPDEEERLVTAPDE
jgi:hypothetical protein